MAKALITGSAGFVGWHFDRYLRATGWQVFGCDINGSPRIDARDIFHHHYERYDLVVHCAAIVGGRETIEGAPLALASNLELDAGLFQWALKTKPGRIIYFSSSAAYPVGLQTAEHVDAVNQNLLPGHTMGLREHSINERLDGHHTGTPDTLYGWTKLTGENLAWRARAEGLKVSVVRPFSGYGESQPHNYPFPAFIDRALHRADPFEIWGNGTQTRDFIHISDIIEAAMTMYHQGIDGPVNLGLGRPTFMAELAEMICEAAGYKPAFQYNPQKPQGVHYRVCDPTRMLEFYRPQISLEAGIHRALAYRSQW